jgi:hypothetical protein
MIQGGRQSPAFIIGYWLSTWLKGAYIAVAMWLGAMGAFFSVSYLLYPLFLPIPALCMWFAVKDAVC